MKLNINGRSHNVDAPDQMLILWVLRDLLGMNGTKYGCGIGQCGACTIHVDGKAVRACVTPIGDLKTNEITTIEGLSAKGKLHPVQEAWIAEDVPQCGYCQSGQIMQATAFLAKNSQPTEPEIIEAMQGNLCRCGTYVRIKKAIQKAAEEMNT